MYLYCKYCTKWSQVHIAYTLGGSPVTCTKCYSFLGYDDEFKQEGL